MSGFKETYQSSTQMIHVSKLLLAQEVLHRPNWVIVRKRQVRTVRCSTQMALGLTKSPGFANVNTKYVVVLNAAEPMSILASKR
ncbi:hypothetical protein KIN20_007388 [Parelaphostrongylus tenuis]|uniref:Uncharacterized protein n=1 Tax=Parelaphostrongylus tenuis TaxID=148309 RepID=A0AAD5M823_PARTN|nr:hypothetical protein KIN20_007388 [Parelaphostrongylus tenuis]